MSSLNSTHEVIAKLLSSFAVASGGAESGPPPRRSHTRGKTPVAGTGLRLILRYECFTPQKIDIYRFILVINIGRGEVT